MKGKEDYNFPAHESLTPVEVAISDALKIAGESVPAGQDWNLNSRAACDMLARKTYAVLLDRKLLGNTVPPINPDK